MLRVALRMHAYSVIAGNHDVELPKSLETLSKTYFIFQLCLDETRVNARGFQYSSVTRDVSLHCSEKCNAYMWIGCCQGTFHDKGSCCESRRLALSRA